MIFLGSSIRVEFEYNSPAIFDDKSLRFLSVASNTLLARLSNDQSVVDGQTNSSSMSGVRGKFGIGIDRFDLLRSE